MQLNITTECNKIRYPICFGSFSAIIMSPSSVKHITGFYRIVFLLLKQCPRHTYDNLKYTAHVIIIYIKEREFDFQFFKFLW
jgi:hypothetical protein